MESPIIGKKGREGKTKRLDNISVKELK